jgi:hypothetical protein
MLSTRRADLQSLIQTILGQQSVAIWCEATNQLNDEITLAELQRWLAVARESLNKSVEIVV